MKRSRTFCLSLLLLAGFVTLGQMPLMAAPITTGSATFARTNPDDAWKDDFKTNFKQFADGMKELAAELGKADSAKDAAAAYQKAAKALTPVAEKMKAIEKEHPEMKEKDKVTAVVGEDVYNQMDQAMGTFFEVGGKVEDKFKDDADFQAALAEMKKVFAD